MPELTAKIELVLFPKGDATPEPGTQTWYILKTDKGILKGKLPFHPQPQDSITFQGENTIYQGEKQFAFREGFLNVPVSERDKLRFVATRTVGIGPATEELIWAKLGDRWRDVEPGEVRGLSDKIIAEYRQQIETLVSKEDEANAVAFLMGKGASQNMACAAWERWQKSAISIVSEDCYQLAELPHYGFNDVDKSIRKSFEIGDEDPRRIRASILYAMNALTTKGDTVVEWIELRDTVYGMLGDWTKELVRVAVKRLFDDKTLVPFQESNSIALGGDYRNETDIIKWVDGK
jgi:hypothetical protein